MTSWCAGPKWPTSPGRCPGSRAWPSCRPPSTWPVPRCTCWPRPGREHVLARAVEPVLGDYDLVLVDCPPSLGVLTINGLTAADGVLIPLQCEALSHRGVGQLLETIDDVRTFANADLGVLGVVATMFDGRTRHARHVLDEVGARYGLVVFDPPVPKSVRFAEAPEFGRSILDHAPDSPGAEAYRAIAAQLGDLLVGV